MGLGKTLQTIALIHTLHYCHHATTIAPTRTYLLLAPASVVHNWKAEFEMWLDKNTSIPKTKRSVPVYLFGDTDEARGKNEGKTTEPQKVSSIESKRNLLEKWRQTGGVFILSFESFRALLKTSSVCYYSSIAFCLTYIRKSKPSEKEKETSDIAFGGGDGMSDEDQKNLETLRANISAYVIPAW
jgi:SNF2 family DNA or RNA helicase